MTTTRTMQSVMALVLAAPVVGRAAQLEIRHEPISCVPLDRYARVSADGVPAEGVARAEVQFRTDPAAAWYTIAMAAVGGRWSALLPSALPSLPGFEYRIVMAARTRAAATTPPFAVHVEAGSMACATTTQDALDSSIVVRIPPGAPVVPPVPPGFSPTGVVPEASQRSASKKALVLAGNATAIGAAAALLAFRGGGGSFEPAGFDIPDFMFSGTIPRPGAVLSVSRSSLVVLVTMSREPQHPVDFLWRLELRANAVGPLCLVMQDAFRGAKSPLGLALSAPLNATGACGARFEVALGRLTINIAGTLAYDTTQSLPFHVEP